MTPKEKADELVKKIFHNLNVKIDQNRINEAKQCALISVYEILRYLTTSDDVRVSNAALDYWEEVNQEIEKL